MKRINCNNSESKAVEFILNGGRKDEIMVFAVMDTEYWFTVGTVCLWTERQPDEQTGCRILLRAVGAYTPDYRRPWCDTNPRRFMEPMRRVQPNIHQRQ